MVEKHFKRSNELKFQVSAFLLVIIAFIFSNCSIFPVLTNTIFFVGAIALIISIFFRFNDFDYTIEDCGDYIIFISDGNNIRIDKFFSMYLSGKHKLILEDDYSSISIYYNYEVVKFLKEINN